MASRLLGNFTPPALRASLAGHLAPHERSRSPESAQSGDRVRRRARRPLLSHTYLSSAHSE